MSWPAAVIVFTAGAIFASALLCVVSLMGKPSNSTTINLHPPCSGMARGYRL